jgi:hypothetical protein
MTWLHDRDETEEEGPDGPRELRNLAVSEISLVDRGANARRYLVIKRALGRGEKEGGAMPRHLTESETAELEGALNRPALREQELVEKALTERGEVGLRALARLVNTYGPDLPADLVAALEAALAGEPAAAPAKAAQDVANLTKAASGLAEIAKASGGRRRELVKATEQEISEDPAAYERHREATLAGYEVDRGQQIAKAATPAWDEVLRRADGLVAKSHDKLTAMAAVNAVLDSDPDLAERYRNEHYSG